MLEQSPQFMLKSPMAVAINPMAMFSGVSRFMLDDLRQLMAKVGVFRRVGKYGKSYMAISNW